mgnify:FL=1
MNGGMMDESALVMESRFVDDGIARLVLEAPGIAAECRPGQFAMLEPSPGAFPVTRRPLTFSGCDRSAGTVSFLFDVVGKGTSLLSEASPGDRIRLLGPLGRGYDITPGRWLLIAGGMGAAGFPFLLSRTGGGLVLAGMRSSRGIGCLPAGSRLATEDGSAGVRGLVTDLLVDIDWDAFDSVAVCGPAPMMKAVVLAAPRSAAHRIQVSMESGMGCGWGVCGGCPVPSSGGGYLSCCKDGPVFRADCIDWERV